jgi:hypothetical protein
MVLVKAPPKTCSNPDCDQPVKAHGMCRRHYNRWLAVRPDGKPCSVSGCPHPAVTRNLCQTHYSKYHYGQRKLNCCTVENCNGSLWAKGLCQRHWRVRRALNLTKSDTDRIKEVFGLGDNVSSKAIKHRFFADVHYIEDQPMKSMTIEELPDVLTSGQVAKACSVAARTVSKWIDSDMLVGYRIPGSKERRVQKSELLSFMRKHNIPLNVSAKKSVVIYSPSRDSVSILLDILKSELPIDIHFVDNLFSAGCMIASAKPHVVFIDVPKLDKSLLPMFESLLTGPSEVVVAASELCVDAATLSALKVEVMKTPYRIADAMAMVASLL